MKHLITVLAFALASFAGVSQAQDDAASAPKAKPHRVRTLTPAQMKMDDCAGQAESKPREERQAFIKDCVGDVTAEPASKAKPHRLRALTPEQKKMNECTAQADGMTRDDRIAFMKKCTGGEEVASDAPAGPKVKAKRVRTLTPEQQKTEDCTSQAEAKPRDDRKAFIRECMAK